MTKFNYKARDSYGSLSEGVMEAESSRSVAMQLSKLGYSPINITEEQSNDAFVQLQGLLNFFQQKIKLNDLIIFTRQLSSIIQAGVPLVEGLEAVHEQISNVKFQKVVMAVKKDIESGKPFSESLEVHKEVFPPLITNMVKAGEKAGILDEELDRLSSLLEKDMETAERIKTAMRYPIIVLASLGIAFAFLTMKVIPSFVGFFSSFGAKLPLPTRILIGINYVAVHYWYWILGGAAAAIYSLRWYIKTEQGGKVWDHAILSIPIFGPLFLKVYLSRFTRMLSAMLNSGIPILEALQITAATIDNKILSRVIYKVREDVSAGKSLTEPMRESPFFPPIAVSMVAIGEKAGTLESMLNRVANYFDREADYTIKNLTPLIEPILIFGLGLIVLLFALGIFMPMWDMMSVYKGH
ncbi:MAG: type II secretion system F family protein [bacterium]